MVSPAHIQEAENRAINKREEMKDEKYKTKTYINWNRIKQKRGRPLVKFYYCKRQWCMFEN